MVGQNHKKKIREKEQKREFSLASFFVAVFNHLISS
jgi:hypothetical protein